MNKTQKTCTELKDESLQEYKNERNTKCRKYAQEHKDEINAKHREHAKEINGKSAQEYKDEIINVGNMYKNIRRK